MWRTSSHILGRIQVLNKISKIAQYENSYKLESENPFNAEGVEKIIKIVMHNSFEDVSYEMIDCSKLCLQAASEIRRRLLKLKFDRYKIVVIVTVTEKASQSLVSSLGYLWDCKNDDCVTYSFETHTFIAYCCVIGTYYE